MNLKRYYLTVELSENGFTKTIETTKVIKYEEGKFIDFEYENGWMNGSEFPPGLDYWRIGCLETDKPRIAIVTLDGTKLDDYVKEAMQIIKDSLEERKTKINKLLEIIN